jgi:hypothetical protein
VLIGEIRDHETARSPSRPRSPGTSCSARCTPTTRRRRVTRLTEMGIEPFLVGSALDCVLAQRLARRLCTRCRQEYRPTPEELLGAGSPGSGGGDAGAVPSGGLLGVRQDRVQGPPGAARGDGRERGRRAAGGLAGLRDGHRRRRPPAGHASLRDDGDGQGPRGRHLDRGDPARRVPAAVLAAPRPVRSPDGATGRAPSRGDRPDRPKRDGACRPRCRGSAGHPRGATWTAAASTARRGRGLRARALRVRRRGSPSHPRPTSRARARHAGPGPGTRTTSSAAAPASRRPPPPSRPPAPPRPPPRRAALHARTGRAHPGGAPDPARAHCGRAHGRRRRRLPPRHHRAAPARSATSTSTACCCGCSRRGASDLHVTPAPRR